MGQGGEAIRLTGKILEISRAPASWYAVIGAEVVERNVGGTLIVDVDGAPITVEVAGEALCDHPLIEKLAAGTLAERTNGVLSSSLPVFAPVKLESVTVEAGAAIEIYGEVLSREFADDGGLRDAPSSRVDRVRALLVSTGADRRARMARAIAMRFPPAARPAPPTFFERRAALARAREREPARQDPSSPTYRTPPLATYHVLLWILLGVTLTASSVTQHELKYAVIALQVAIAVVVFRPTPLLCPFRAREDHYGGWHPSSTWWIGFIVTFVMALGIDSDADTGATAVAVVGLIEIAVAFGIGYLGRTTYGYLARLRRTPPWTGELGVHASFEGIVRDPTPATIGEVEVAIASGTGYDKREGSSPDSVVWHRFHSAGTFLIDTKVGVVEVSPDQVLWATSVRERIETPVGADYALVELIPIGARVIACGWIQAGADRRLPTLCARRSEPALVIATSAAGDPRGWLDRLARARAVTAIGLGAIAAGLIVAGWFA